MMTNKKNEIKPWEEVSREVMFEKFGRGIEKVIFRLQNGEEQDYYIKKENNVVAIVALTENNEIILTKQFRPGPKKVLLELPGGYIDKNEKPEQAGARELLEETGYTGDAQFVTSLVDCGYSVREKNCVVITNCKKVAGQNLDGTEFINVELISLKEFRELLRSGQNTDIEIGYLGLDYLGLLGDGIDK